MKFKRYILMLLFVFTGVLSSFAQSVKVTQLESKKPAAYDIVFQADQDIAPQGEIDIIFPQDFNISQVILADSRTLTGGLTVTVNKDTVKIKRSGLGDVVSAGSTPDIKLATVINPQDMDKEYDFRILIRENNRVISNRTLTSTLSPRN